MSLAALFQRQFRSLANLDITLLEPTDVPDGGGGFEGGVPVEHPCRGWWGKPDTTTTATADREVLRRRLTVLADTLDIEPTDDHSVTVSRKTYRIVSATQDQLGAVWIIEVQP